jgi:hypothetical protein
LIVNPSSIKAMLTTSPSKPILVIKELIPPKNKFANTIAICRVETVKSYYDELIDTIIPESLKSISSVEKTINNIKIEYDDKLGKTLEEYFISKLNTFFDEAKVILEKNNSSNEEIKKNFMQFIEDIKIEIKEIFEGIKSLSPKINAINIKLEDIVGQVSLIRGVEEELLTKFKHFQKSTEYEFNIIYLITIGVKAFKGKVTLIQELIRNSIGSLETGKEAIEILEEIIDTYTIDENKLDKLTTKSESELFLILIEIVRNIKILESNIYHTNILSTNLEEIDNTAKATSFSSLIAAITIIQNNNNIFKRSLC